MFQAKKEDVFTWFTLIWITFEKLKINSYGLLSFGRISPQSGAEI